MLCLLRSHPRQWAQGENGQVAIDGVVYDLAHPSWGWDGREGMSLGQSTGWYCPRMWITATELVERMLHEWQDSDWRSAEGRRAEAWLLVREYISTPDDHAGLDQHYPEVVRAYHGHPAVVADRVTRHFATGIDSTVAEMPTYVLADWLRDRGHDDWADYLSAV